MANYEKPVIIDTEEHYEGVYAASGDNTDSGVSAPKCDSKYMNGVWHAPGSYDVDNGNRYPNWERIGHQPYDAIDWGDVGMC